MKNKHFYQIFKLKIKPWMKYWLIKQTEFKGVLSDILEGISFYLTDSLNMKFKMFDIIGRTTQESTTGANIMKFTPRTVSNQGINYICDNGGSVKLTGTATSGLELAYNQSQDKLTLASGTYKLKCVGNNIPTALKRTDINTSFNLDLNGEATITIDTDNTEFRILIIATNGTTYNYDFYITLTPGTTATTERYTGGEPAPNPNYSFPIKNTGDNGSVNEKVSNSDGTQEQNPSFPLSQGQKLMQGDYPDDDEKVHHVSGKMLFDGSSDENWIYNPTYAYFYITTTGFKSIDFCDNYSKETSETLTNNHFRFNPNNGNLYIKDERFTSASSFKTNLATNNIILQGELAEEQTEDFTEEQKTAWEQIKKARTYKNITHISSEDETPAELKIQYWKEV